MHPSARRLTFRPVVPRRVYSIVISFVYTGEGQVAEPSQ
jgi:hypothetical protein